ncbi:MAG TPA: methyltransferase domain-containing protein [Caulobacteraceae bacterium]|jgi:SAM-dependent methyltransferase|nr:methyltransferase domain-containing protein [Caulobacteraceae bacterium]
MGLGLKALPTRLDGAFTDCLLGIATEAPRPSPDLSRRNEHYEPLPYEALRPMGRALACGPGDTVVDLGCGKGRLVCWFARQGVALCRGVDIDPELTSAAQRNASRLRGARAPIEIVCGDAAKAALDDATVVTMYNPFGAEVMSAVARRLAASLDSTPRALRIAYANPVQLASMTEVGFEVVSRFQAPYFGGRIEIVLLTRPTARDPAGVSAPPLSAAANSPY